MKTIRRFFPWMILLTFSVSLLGCVSNQLRSDDLYPDQRDFQIDEEAEILDTTDARELLDILFQYRQALVSKDFGTLNRLISKSYYDNAGTTHTTADDYGWSELEDVFEQMARYAEEIQYRITVKELQVEGPRAHIDFEFEYAFQYRVGDKETWDAGTDVNRLEFVRDGDQWRISSGTRASREPTWPWMRVQADDENRRSSGY